MDQATRQRILDVDPCLTDVVGSYVLLNVARFILDNDEDRRVAIRRECAAVIQDAGITLKAGNPDDLKEASRPPEHVFQDLLDFTGLEQVRRDAVRQRIFKTDTPLSYVLIFEGLLTEQVRLLFEAGLMSDQSAGTTTVVEVLCLFTDLLSPRGYGGDNFAQQVVAQLRMIRGVNAIPICQQMEARMLSKPPEILVAAVQFDRLSRTTDLAATMASYLEDMALVTCLADGSYSGCNGILSAYGQMLANFLNESGVPTAPDGKVLELHEAFWRTYRDARAGLDVQRQQAGAPRSGDEGPSPTLVTNAGFQPEGLSELSQLVGLAPVKQDVQSLTNFITVQKLRKVSGLPEARVAMHLVFEGNPGTGKTSVARLVANIYRSLGVLSNGHLVETDRSGLVAGYLGQTALKVHEVVERARGGILFIDEAYSLASTLNGDYGGEAIEALLKLMEDYRDDLVVIVAGYPARMQRFLEANPGLRSRFNKVIQFPDYDPIELYEIFVKMCGDARYELSPEADGAAQDLFMELYSKRCENFGNGRTVRNIFERTQTRNSDRVVLLRSPTAKELTTIEVQDLPLRESFS